MHEVSMAVLIIVLFYRVSVSTGIHRSNWSGTSSDLDTPSRLRLHLRNLLDQRLKEKRRRNRIIIFLFWLSK